MARIETILLATDASTASRAAEARGEVDRLVLGGRLIVLSVVAGVPSVRASRLLAVEAIVQRARAGGAETTGLTWDGDAGESIVEASESEAADLIVVGTHERGTVGRLFLGSVSDHVVRHARCPVLVVRPTRVVNSA
jgi:nucleotide-binding universal stress UspA family protein